MQTGVFLLLVSQVAPKSISGLVRRCQMVRLVRGKRTLQKPLQMNHQNHPSSPSPWARLDWVAIDCQSHHCPVLHFEGGLRKKIVKYAPQYHALHNPYEMG